VQARNWVQSRSLQKVQGHRTAQGHRAGVDVEVTPPTGGPVRLPPNPATLCDRSAQRSKSWHSGSFAKYSDIGLVTISFPTCCVSHRATGLPVMVHDMHTRRTRPDYLQACPNWRVDQHVVNKYSAFRCRSGYKSKGGVQGQNSPFTPVQFTTRICAFKWTKANPRNFAKTMCHVPSSVYTCSSYYRLWIRTWSLHFHPSDFVSEGMDSNKHARKYRKLFVSHHRCKLHLKPIAPFHQSSRRL